MLRRTGQSHTPPGRASSTRWKASSSINQCRSKRRQSSEPGLADAEWPRSLRLRREKLMRTNNPWLRSAPCRAVDAIVIRRKETSLVGRLAALAALRIFIPSCREFSAKSVLGNTGCSRTPTVLQQRDGAFPRQNSPWRCQGSHLSSHPNPRGDSRRHHRIASGYRLESNPAFPLTSSWTDSRCRG